MVETKYALKTAVNTTVVYPEFAKSRHAHEKTSDVFTPDLNKLDWFLPFRIDLFANDNTFLNFHG
jgi:hypothetical protein